MKLYLSSDGFLTKSQFKKLVGKNYKDSRVALIMNAVDWKTAAERKSRYAFTQARFRKIGIEADLLDLRKFYRKPRRSLAEKLKRYDLIWVRGGNSFFLRYVMHKSGFDSAIKKALSAGVVYAGESAGALVMGPALKYIGNIDNSDVAPKMIRKGIGLVDVVPLPHWGNRNYVRLDEVYASFRREHIRVIKLRDGEALLVDDGEIRKVRTNKSWKR